MCVKFAEYEDRGPLNLQRGGVSETLSLEEKQGRVTDVSHAP